MKKKILAVLLGITMTLGLAGCGASSGSTVSASPQETVSQAAGSEGTSMEASAPDASSGQETPSQEEQAALSGKVVVYCPSPAGLADKMAEAFTAKTGVQVEMFQGTTGEILARLEAEKANPIADVVIMASWADGLGMIQDDQVLSYEPANTDKMNPRLGRCGQKNLRLQRVCRRCHLQHHTDCPAGCRLGGTGQRPCL